MDNMNVEENRLLTFSDWPTDVDESPENIAKAGFFYTRQDRKVECFSCHITISDWSCREGRVMVKHKFISPNCLFVNNPVVSGNVPTDQLPPSSNVDPLEKYETEAARLRSFVNWPIPHIVSPENLARAGLFSLQRSDSTQCAFCAGIMGAWEIGDDPDSEHKRHFPHCPFVVVIITPRLEQLTNINTRDLHNRHSNLPNINLVREGNLTELGVHAHKRPKKPKYGTLDARMNTFVNWPDDLIQTSDVLAQAGFYYEGLGDQVRCFHCDGGLKHWDPQDDPWTEHARWFPNCGFILLLKGPEFIIACAPELDPVTNKELQIQKGPVQQRKDVSEREIQSHMTLPPALAALNIGLSVGRVKQAIREKLERTGIGFSSEDALIEATLNLQRDEDEEVDPHISRSVTNMLNDVLQRSLIDARKEQQQLTDTLVTMHMAAPSNCPLVNKSAESEDAQNLTLEEENRQLKEARLCKICMDGEVGVVFLPCGHLATCINCAPNLQDCPVCRSPIKATVRTFFS